MDELNRLRSQNKTMRKLLESLINVTANDIRDTEPALKKYEHIRSLTIGLLKHIDNFEDQRTERSNSQQTPCVTPGHS